MDVKTFEAYTMKDAVKSVKKALGNDAVILSTREKQKSDGKGRVFEVTAAAATKELKRSGGMMLGGASGSSATSSHVETQLDGIALRLAAMQDNLPSRRQVQTVETGMHELKVLLLECLRDKDGSAIKDLPPYLVGIDRQLRVMGIDDTQIAELIKHLRNIPLPQGDAPGQTKEALSEYYKDQAIRWMMKRIRIAPRWPVMPGAMLVQVVVGPTGVGKSALVAKLAALYHLREKKKVLVISFDNQRLAAADQMRVYCKVIGVPFASISAASELPGVLQSHSEAELVIVDTAGRSLKADGVIEDLEAFKELSLALDFHLCLSVTEKESQLDQAVRAFSPLGLASLAFSKLDESWSFGEIYNMSRKWSLPLSFFAIGQHIPDDVERATRERVIERIFGL